MYPSTINLLHALNTTIDSMAKTRNRLIVDSVLEANYLLGYS